MIDPMRLGLAVLDSVNQGAGEGRRRAFDQIKAAQAGYNRAAQELNDKIKLEQLEFEINTLRPLHLAKIQADVQYSRNRAASAAAQSLQQTVQEDQELNEQAASIQKLSALTQFIPQINQAINETDALIKENEQLSMAQPSVELWKKLGKSELEAQFLTGTLPSTLENQSEMPPALEKRREMLAEQKKNLEAAKKEAEMLSASAGANLYFQRRQLLAMANSPSGNSRDALMQRQAAIRQLAATDNLIENLAQANPIAFQSYNVRAAMPYLDLLETEEQKEKFQLRVMQRTTPLTPEAADVLIKQITSPTATNEVKLQDQINLLERLNKQIEPLQRMEMAGRLGDDDKVMLSTLIQLRSDVLKSINQKEALGKETTVTDPPILGAQDESTSQQDAALTDEQIQKLVTDSDRGFVGRLATSTSEVVYNALSSTIAEPIRSAAEVLNPSLSRDIDNAIKKQIDLYDRKLITRDEMNQAIETVLQSTGSPEYSKMAEQLERGDVVAAFSQFFRPSRLARGARAATNKLSARSTITVPVFSSSEIDAIKTKRNSPLARAFVEAYNSLSPETKNDISDIAILVNRKLETQFTPLELVKELRKLL